MTDSTMTLPTVSAFAALGLDPRLVDPLTKLGYEEPTPIQREAIPPLLAGKDLVGLAATGTGKTAAFALPLLHRLAANPGRKKPAAIILVPTRELAMQVTEAVTKYGKPLGITVVAVYGGTAYGPQVSAIRRGVDVIVATPGRALDLVKNGQLKLNDVNTVILDEADEMLDMGFADDIDAILSGTPKERQTMLFSATMPPRIAQIAGKHLNQPVRVEVARDLVPAGEMPKVKQMAYLVHRQQKPAALARILGVENPTAAIVFCRTRNEVDELCDALLALGFRPDGLHGGLSQEQRDRVMKKFRDGTTPFLIATDVAARGLDIGHLSHVINYHVPPATEPYVHRIGRVGRAGRTGVAITLVEPKEQYSLKNIERATRRKITFAAIPTSAEFRAKRIARIQDSLKETIEAGELNEFKAAVQALSDEIDPVVMAAAALKLVFSAGKSAEDDVEIPAPPPPIDKPARETKTPGKAAPNGVVAPRSAGPRRTTMTRLFVGGGRDTGVTLRDLVDAIESEVGLTRRELGGIEIAERFSLVEVPNEAADEAIELLNGIRLRGRKVVVRRERGA